MKKNNIEITLFELRAIVSFIDTYKTMSKESQKELFETYYKAMEEAKITGNWNITINIIDKPNLINFLTEISSNKINKKILSKNI